MARKRKRAIGILKNKFDIVAVTAVVVVLAIILGLKVHSIKQELAKRESYNQKIVEELESEDERAKKAGRAKKICANRQLYNRDGKRKTWSGFS